MTRIPLALLLLALLCLAGPALAHHGEPHPPLFAHATRPAAAIQEVRRERANPDAPPGVPAQRRAAEEAEQADLAGARGNLAAARQALAERRHGQANEFLERAEARPLTRASLAARAGEKLTAGPVAHIAAARAALQRQGHAAAAREGETVLALASRARGPR